MAKCGKVGIPSSPGPMLRWLMDGSGPYGDSERCDVDADEDAVTPKGDMIRLSGVVFEDEDDTRLRSVVADSEKAARSDIGAAGVSNAPHRDLRVQSSRRELGSTMPSSANRRALKSLMSRRS